MSPRRVFAWSLVAASFAAPFISASCGSSGNTATGGSSAGTAGSSTSVKPSASSSSSGAPGDGGVGGMGGGGITLGDGSTGCSTGQACGDGGICAGKTCCDANLACGDVCCPGGQVCSFLQCVTPGAPCTDSSDCNPGEYCESALGSDGGLLDAGCVGAMLATGQCLPVPPTCDGGLPDAGAITCLEQCTYHPTGTFNPVLKYSWGGVIMSPYNTDVMMAPIVLPLEDTNCDQKIDGRDVPSIVFTSFAKADYHDTGTLHAIRVVDGALADRWAAKQLVNPAAQIAGGNIDGNPGNEIVACGAPYKVNDAGPNQVDVMAFNGADGSLLWKTTIPSGCSMPAIADLDGDGKPEVIVEYGVLDGATGALKATTNGGTFVISDIDGDGKLDIVTAAAAYHADGTKFASVPLTSVQWPAIGDLDLDGKPEVIAVDYASHEIAVWHYDPSSPTMGTVITSGVDINGTAPQHCRDASAGYSSGGGPPTVADFNGDGVPDVALAGGIAYSILDGKKLMANDPSPIIWTSVTTDCSSAATGSSVFDFDGKGIAQAVYSDEDYLRIYNGVDGGVIWQTCNTTGTLEELPVVADVDNDGHADIVVVSNAYAAGSSPASEIYCSDDPSDASAPHAQSGVRVFSDANATWVRTRSIWNQHSYHVTNVNDDGTIPQNEQPNWLQTGLNDFRQNKSPGSEFAASDLVVSLAPVCPGPTALAAVVRNIGQAAVPAGVVVGFYEGTPPGTKLGQASTTQVLYPAESQVVVFPLSKPDPGLVSGATPVFAKVDDSPSPHPSWHECDTSNNASAPVSAKCAGAQ